ncbi:MAG: 5-(carboxyamino)imidazole ribonucleotide synthase [Verrucomicrobiota bacterium]
MASAKESPRFGILGGGQLARMLAQAAQRLDVRTEVWDADRVCPAASSALVHPEAMEKEAALACGLFTLESENVGLERLRQLEAWGCHCAPKADVLAALQDKVAQKELLAGLGAKLPAFEVVESVGALQAFGQSQGWPVVLKKRTGGYDGRGNATVHRSEEAEAAWELLGGRGLYVEAFCPFERELAIQVVRGRDGERKSYPLVDSVQENHICKVVTAPSEVPESLAQEARDLAYALVEEIEYVGVLAVEFFLTSDGFLWVNEVAPRVHNSGHYTMDATACGQFENHVRAILGWPLGDTRLWQPAAMVNVLGDGDGRGFPRGVAQALAVPGARLHLYGKARARAGRKMGHVNALAASASEARERAEKAANSLTFVS